MNAARKTSAIASHPSDDALVQQVGVVITDVDDTVLEQGNATDEGALWWTYTTQATINGNAQALVSAMDLPGHITELSQQKEVGNTPS